MKKIELLKKDWSQKDINRVSSVLDTARPHDVHFSKIVFWSALVVIIFANLLVSLILVPFLTVLNQEMLYLLIIILAGTIGFLYNFLITDIGHLEKKHHLLASIIVPVAALVNLAVIVFISNKWITELKINNQPHNFWIIAIIFVAAFLLSTLVSRIRAYIREKK